MRHRITDKLRWGLDDDDVRDLGNKCNTLMLPIEDEKSFNRAVLDWIKGATSMADLE